MIPRYSRPEMAKIWEPENRFRIWLEIETLACEQQAKLGVIPQEAVKVIRDKGNFDIARIDAIEAEVKHDVIAFLTSVAEYVGPEARFVHQGMTSSDVLDTCLSVQLVQAADELLADLDALLETIKQRALEHKDTVCMGRSHGIHAEPVTFGLKLAGWYAEMERNRTRLQAARESIATGAISGAVGTFANIDPSVEEYVCEKLGLKPEPVSTQVIPRDRHAELFCVLAIIASSMERIAIEVRHLQRTEVLETIRTALLVAAQASVHLVFVAAGFDRRPAFLDAEAPSSPVFLVRAHFSERDLEPFRLYLAENVRGGFRQP